jgi:hypothetical protein
LRKASGTNDTTRATAKAWLSLVGRLKDYLNRHPEEAVPEFQVQSESRWLNAVDISMSISDFPTPDDYYKRGAYFMRVEAGEDFGIKGVMALRKFSDANNGQFPTNLAQLRPYCDGVVAGILEGYYEIRPASIVPAEAIREGQVVGDWVVARKQPIDPQSQSLGAFSANGNFWWQAPPGQK